MAFFCYLGRKSFTKLSSKKLFHLNLKEIKLIQEWGSSTCFRLCFLYRYREILLYLSCDNFDTRRLLTNGSASSSRGNALSFRGTAYSNIHPLVLKIGLHLALKRIHFSSQKLSEEIINN